jgi:alpha-tubulin suppressor-like RCC1 family protein
LNSATSAVGQALCKSLGGCHTIGLKSDGTVVSAGNDSSGQCDVDGWMDIIKVAAGYDHTVGLKSDGTVVAVGNNEYGQCDISNWDLH